MSRAGGLGGQAGGRELDGVSTGSAPMTEAAIILRGGGVAKGSSGQ